MYIAANGASSNSITGNCAGTVYQLRNHIIASVRDYRGRLGFDGSRIGYTAVTDVGRAKNISANRADFIHAIVRDADAMSVSGRIAVAGDHTAVAALEGNFQLCGAGILG